jgi:Skp family chaperone for outer membrane proteins
MAASAFAQTGAQPGAGKIAWLDTGAFADEKGGISKYLGALKQIDAEMKPRVTELQGIQARLKTISDDLNKMQSNPAVPIDQKAFAAKQDEGQQLQRTGEFKKKELDAAVDKRNNELLGPITADILKAVQEYAKQKGYAAVLDIAMLDQAHAILALDSSADITKDFITFYNSRPGSTATTATPK